MGKYADFHARSLEQRDEFWAEQAALIDWQTPPRQICDFSRPPFAKWFAGGRTNLCHNAVDRHAAQRPNDRALIYVSTETNEERIYSFAELKSEVMRMAAIMQSLGVGRGDRVLIYMPMIAEAAFAMLACMRIGAIHSVVFGGFAAGSLATRIDDAKPKLIVSSDAGMRGGRVVAYKHLLDEACALASFPPQKVLMVDRGLDPGWHRVTGGMSIMPGCALATWLRTSPANGWSPASLATFFTLPAPPANRKVCSAIPAAIASPLPRQ